MFCFALLKLNMIFFFKHHNHQTLALSIVILLIQSQHPKHSTTLNRTQPHSTTFNHTQPHSTNHIQQLLTSVELAIKKQEEFIKYAHEQKMYEVPEPEAEHSNPSSHLSRLLDALSHSPTSMRFKSLISDMRLSH